ncbi:MAG: hypothetical protein O7F76_03750 [Planctomycetota bacterium]|nr:hypothetical protein [Planctomycetota bacterium]
MGFNFGNNTKASCQKLIKSKQAFFNRIKRRCKVAKDPSERRFLKSEAMRCCNEIKQCCKQWKNCGFGACTWITKNFTMTCFTSGIKNTVRKVGRKTSARKSYASTSSRSTRRTTASRPKARITSRKRTSARRSYVAW